MADKNEDISKTIVDKTQTLIERAKSIDFNLQGNIVLLVLIGVSLLWIFSIISPTIIILLFIGLNIYGLYYLYQAGYINIDMYKRFHYPNNIEDKENFEENE